MWGTVGTRVQRAPKTRLPIHHSSIHLNRRSPARLPSVLTTLDRTCLYAPAAQCITAYVRISGRRAKTGRGGRSRRQSGVVYTSSAKVNQQWIFFKPSMSPTRILVRKSTLPQLLQLYIWSSNNNSTEPTLRLCTWLWTSIVHTHLSKQNCGGRGEDIYMREYWTEKVI